MELVSIDRQTPAPLHARHHAQRIITPSPTAHAVLTHTDSHYTHIVLRHFLSFLSKVRDVFFSVEVGPMPAYGALAKEWDVTVCA
jgi:hypothetical protein